MTYYDSKGQEWAGYDGPSHYPTRHVVEKINSREVSWGEILEVAEKPEVSFGPDYKGRMTHQRGNLCVVVGRDKAIITVLLRSTEQWTDEDAKNRASQE